jgi:hypothetical protein
MTALPAIFLLGMVLASGPTVPSRFHNVAVVTIGGGGELATRDVPTSDACDTACTDHHHCTAWSFTPETRAECPEYGCCFLKASNVATIDAYMRLCTAFTTGCNGIVCTPPPANSTCPCTNAACPFPPPPPPPPPPPSPPRFHNMGVVTIGSGGELATRDVSTPTACEKACTERRNCTAWSYTPVMQAVCPEHGCCFLKAGNVTTIDAHMRVCSKYTTGCMGIACTPPAANYSSCPCTNATCPASPLPSPSLSLIPLATR